MTRPTRSLIWIAGFLAAIAVLAALIAPRLAQAFLANPYFNGLILLVLLVVRLVAHRRIEPWLQRVNDWLMRQAGELTSWIVAIVGILLARAGADAFGGIGEVATAVSSVVQQAVQGLVPFG